MAQMSGKKEVSEFLESKIKIVEDAFLDDIKGNEKEFVTVILSVIEGTLSQGSLQASIGIQLNTSNQTIKHDSIQLLNTIFERGPLKTIGLTAPANIQGVVSYVSTGILDLHTLKQCVIAFNTHFENISKLKTLLLQCQKSEHYTIEINNQGEPAFDTNSFRIAREEWLDESKTNKDWDAFFFEDDANNIKHFFKEISQMSEDMYGFPLEPVYFIGHLFNLMRKDRRLATLKVSPTMVPLHMGTFTTLPRNAIEGPLKNEYPTISDVQIETFLGSIEYSLEKYPSQAPFFSMLRDTEPVYYVWSSAPGFETIWLAEIIKEKGGTLKTRYGDSFDFFVRERISKHTSLGSLDTDLKISKTRFSDAINMFQKYDRDSLQIDAIAWDETNVFVISCKAHDFFFDQEQYSKLFLVPYSDFYSRTLRNFDEICEVCMWVDILDSSKEFRRELDIGTKKLVPMLITPRKNPLQINSVKSWFSKAKKVEIPYCEVLSIRDLELQYAKT